MKAKTEQAAESASALYEKDLSTTPEHEAAVLKCGHYDGFVAGAEWQAANPPELTEDPSASIADDIIHRLNEFTVSDAIRIAACKGRQYGGELARRDSAKRIAELEGEVERLKGEAVAFAFWIGRKSIHMPAHSNAWDSMVGPSPTRWAKNTVSLYDLFRKETGR